MGNILIRKREDANNFFGYNISRPIVFAYIKGVVLKDIYQQPQDNMYEYFNIMSCPC